MAQPVHKMATPTEECVCLSKIFQPNVVSPEDKILSPDLKPVTGDRTVTHGHRAMRGV